MCTRAAAEQKARRIICSPVIYYLSAQAQAPSARNKKKGWKNGSEFVMP
jgi:hypothetical protein